MLKCDLINEAMCNIKRTLSSDSSNSKKLQDLIPDYLQVVNLGRIVIVHLIKTLYKNKINIDNDIVQKYMRVDNDLDSTEKLNIKNKIMNFNYIKAKMPKDNEKISKFNIIF